MEQEKAKPETTKKWSQEKEREAVEHCGNYLINTGIITYIPRCFFIDESALDALMKFPEVAIGLPDRKEYIEGVILGGGKK